MYSLILHGKRLGELQKWRNLRFVVKLVQTTSFSSSSSSATATAAADVSPRDGRKEKNFSVSYLVGSLGLTTKLAESISRKVSFKDKGNPDSVLNLLRNHGFTDSQISGIIRTYPGLLILDAEKSLGPKLQFLQSRVTSSSELTEILSKVPKILGMKEDKTISVYFDFVKEIIEADKSSKYKKLCLSLPQGSHQENKIRNVLVLRELGVPQRLLLPLLISDNHVCYGKEKFEESLKKVVELGFDPTTSKFVEALRMVYQLSDKTLEEKVNVYKRLGFAVGDVWEMFKKYPNFLVRLEKKIVESIEIFVGLGFSRDEFVMMVKCFPPCLKLSTESIKKKTEFLVKKMNWPLKVVALRPQVIGLSMEKRIVPRCNVIKALISKGLLGTETPVISSVLVCTDETFLKRYVRKYDDKELEAELMAILFTGRQQR